MSREIVGDDVDLASGRLGSHDLGQKVHELCAGVAVGRSLDDLAAFGLEEAYSARVPWQGRARHFLPM